ncbi:MAG TPA: efflux RND transporter periplasmic adaptor subunit [Desulfuromonadales bacterium]|nr:efflux RND transporter periplasmic adaptor subunit [Desulfuromonadales bacterium]
MTKRMVIMLVLVGLLFGGIFGFQAFKAKMIKKYMASKGVPPQTVSAIKASEQDWQKQIDVVGSLRAVRGADLAPEVSGLVTRINFKSGDEVKAGKLLVELDPSADIAKLQSLKATAELAEKTYQRDLKQFKEQAISQATLDSDAANLKSARAQVSQQQVLVDQKVIRAPFSGRLGIRAVDLGQYLNPGAKIVTLQTLDPIYVDFYLPQKEISQIAVGQKVSVNSDAYPDRHFSGTISAIDPKVDTATRNVAVRAAIHNPKHLLLPGMFVTTEIKVGKPQSHITLPQTAISFNPYGNIVFLIKNNGKGPDGKPKLTAIQKFVTTGDTRGDQVAILKGVTPGELVVTSGQIKLRNGSTVLINNSIEPANNPAPTPKDE